MRRRNTSPALSFLSLPPSRCVYPPWPYAIEMAFCVCCVCVVWLLAPPASSQLHRVLATSILTFPLHSLSCNYSQGKHIQLLAFLSARFSISVSCFLPVSSRRLSLAVHADAFHSHSFTHFFSPPNSPHSIRHSHVNLLIDLTAFLLFSPLCLKPEPSPSLSLSLFFGQRTIWLFF